jgi:hypothetical protein
MYLAIILLTMLILPAASIAVGMVRETGSFREA